MANTQFTQQELIAAAVEKYGKSISVDFLDDAMKAESLEHAVEILLIDSAFWDGSFTEEE